jgi:hypothetical protein
MQIPNKFVHSTRLGPGEHQSLDVPQLVLKKILSARQLLKFRYLATYSALKFLLALIFVGIA